MKYLIQTLFSLLVAAFITFNFSCKKDDVASKKNTDTTTVSVNLNVENSDTIKKEDNTNAATVKIGVDGIDSLGIKLPVKFNFTNVIADSIKIFVGDTLHRYTLTPSKNYAYKVYNKESFTYSYNKEGSYLVVVIATKYDTNGKIIKEAIDSARIYVVDSNTDIKYFTLEYNDKTLSKPDRRLKCSFNNLNNIYTTSVPFYRSELAKTTILLITCGSEYAKIFYNDIGYAQASLDPLVNFEIPVNLHDLKKLIIQSKSGIKKEYFINVTFLPANTDNVLSSFYLVDTNYFKGNYKATVDNVTHTITFDNYPFGAGGKVNFYSDEVDKYRLKLKLVDVNGLYYNTFPGITDATKMLESEKIIKVASISESSDTLLYDFKITNKATMPITSKNDLKIYNVEYQKEVLSVIQYPISIPKIPSTIIDATNTIYINVFEANPGPKPVLTLPVDSNSLVYQKYLADSIAYNKVLGKVTLDFKGNFFGKISINGEYLKIFDSYTRHNNYPTLNLMKLVYESQESAKPAIISFTGIGIGNLAIIKSARYYLKINFVGK